MQFVNILSIILTLPLLMSTWGKEVYADWLLIFALPSFFTLADLGFGQAVASEVAKLWAAGELEEANKIFQAGLTIIVVSCTVCGLIFIPVVHFAPIRHWLKVTNISESVTEALLAIFATQVLIAQVVGVLRSAFRTQGLESLSVAITSLNSIGTLIAVLITWLIKGTPLFLASMMFLVSVIVIGLIFFEGRRRVTWLKFKFCRVTLESVKPILAPGIGMNLITLAQGLSLSGTLLAVSNAVNPQAALVFSATRTLTRAVNQLTNMVTYTFYSEFSTSIGAGNYELAKKLHHRASQVSLWIALISSIGLSLVCKPIFSIWTKNRLHFDTPLFAMLLFALVVNGIYSGSIAAPMAVNKHFKMSVFYCAASIVSVVICWIASHVLGIVGAGIGVLALEVIMLFIVVPIAINIVHDDPKDWFKATFTPNFQWLIQRAVRKPQ